MTWATSANFSLPRPLCSPVRPDVRDTDRQMPDRRQTDVRQTDRRQTKASLTMPPLWGERGITAQYQSSADPTFSLLRHKIPAA